MVVIGEHVHDVYLDVCEVAWMPETVVKLNSDASAQKKNPLLRVVPTSLWQLWLTDEFDVRCGHYQRHFVDCRSMRVAIR